MKRTKIYIAIDLQNDFIDGVFGTKEAVAIVPKVINFLSSLDENNLVIFTKDTHEEIENTVENKFLPLHCVKNTSGWEINKDIFEAKKGLKEVIEKPTFGSITLMDYLNKEMDKHNKVGEEVELVIFGICTDICVISNALILRSKFLDTKISVIQELCSATTPLNHEAALNILRSNLINII